MGFKVWRQARPWKTRDVASCSIIFWSLGELRKGLTTGSRILFRYVRGFKVLVNSFKGRECTPHHLPQPQFLAHRVELSVNKRGVEHGHGHLYNTERYGSRLTKEHSVSYVVASYQPLSYRQSFIFLSSCMVFIKIVLKTCKLPIMFV